MTTTQISGDVFAEIAGITPGSRADELRQQRPAVTENTQATFNALFEPTVEAEADLSRVEREAVAIWSATLAGNRSIADYHRQRLVALGDEGLHLLPGASGSQPLNLSEREQAIYRHTELLTRHPADAREEDIQRLLGVGVTPAGIVTLAHINAFLAFEIRTFAVIRAIEEGAS